MNDATVDSAWRLHRKRVLDVCYQVLGTLADAEDAVSDTFARLTRNGTAGIDDIEGWLVTVAGRVCLDRLRADRARSRYVGPWLPEPDPADQVTLDDSVRLALLAVLRTLSPAERVAFVLHDVFGLTFEEVGQPEAGEPGQDPRSARTRSPASKCLPRRPAMSPSSSRRRAGPAT
jgi:RNA polymerase sigma-70 factor (ECF subfamily)